MRCDRFFLIVLIALRSQWLLSCGSDNTVRLWDVGANTFGNQPLVLSHSTYTPTSAAASNLSNTAARRSSSADSMSKTTARFTPSAPPTPLHLSDNPPFKSIAQAQFFYKDKFILAAFDSNVGLFSYALDTKGCVCVLLCLSKLG